MTSVPPFRWRGKNAQVKTVPERLDMIEAQLEHIADLNSITHARLGTWIDLFQRHQQAVMHNHRIVAKVEDDMRHVEEEIELFRNDMRFLKGELSDVLAEEAAKRLEKDLQEDGVGMK